MTTQAPTLVAVLQQLGLTQQAVHETELALHAVKDQRAAAVAALDHAAIAAADRLHAQLDDDLRMGRAAIAAADRLVQQAQERIARQRGQLAAKLASVTEAERFRDRAQQQVDQWQRAADLARAEATAARHQLLIALGLPVDEDGALDETLAALDASVSGESVRTLGHRPEPGPPPEYQPPASSLYNTPTGDRHFDRHGREVDRHGQPLGGANGA